MTTNLHALLQTGADSDSALLQTGGRPLTYGALRQLAHSTMDRLNGLGIGRGDRVAIVLPNGPEMAAAFVAIGAAATTAPLNPAYRAEEFAFYLSDLNAKALVVAAGSDSPAIAVAAEQGIPVLTLEPEPAAGAGAFSLAGETIGTADRPGWAAADDIALVLHTSGTISRPKIVPLTQANVTASAAHIRDSLALTAADRCLNIMPLFHIHGLIAAVLSSLSAGASIVCAPGFNALKVFQWFAEAKPSWYTAVPTMHQAILARAGRNQEQLDRMALRLIRSSSSSLPPQVMAELEDTFGCPVIEAYGMTEAAHQMASNPLPPRAQKPGSVGIAAGPEVRIAHEVEDRLIEGTGEVVISGPNVTPGYEGNPEANAKSFFEAEGKRWFRTGDQGAFDDEGYLTLTGRLKEIINRGGEKVSPLEVDGVLSAHPDVAQVVTFALPHPKLGEEVAAAIVLHERAAATEADLKAFAAERVAAFKVPRKVVILDEIPKGATGKLQRIGLAEKLGLVEEA